MEKLKDFIKREVVILLGGAVITGLVLALCKIFNHIALELYGEGSLPYIIGVQTETFLYILCTMLILGLTFVNVIIIIGLVLHDIIDKDIK